MRRWYDGMYQQIAAHLGNPFRRRARPVFDFDDKLKFPIWTVYRHIGASHCMHLRSVARSKLAMIVLAQILSHP